MKTFKRFLTLFSNKPFSGWSLRHVTTLLLTLTLFATNAWGKEYALTDVSTPTEAVTDGFTFTFTKGTNDAAWVSSEARVYAGGSLIISSETNTITNIQYAYVANKGGKAKVAPTITGVSGSVNAGTWNESAKTWSDATGDKNITLSTSGTAGNLGFTAITITYTSGGTSYTVTYDKNGGEGTMTNSTGSSIIIKDNEFTAPSGKVFGKWNTKANGSGDDYLPGATVTKNLDLFAQWVAKTAASITLSDADGTTNPTGYYTGDQYTLPTTAASCSGKEFVGWSTVTVATTDTKPTTNFYNKGAKVTLLASQTFYAVYAKATEGTPTSLAGGDMSYGVTSGWTASGTGTYSGNGVKFDGGGDYILSPDISSNGLTTVTVKLTAGHNGGSGSVLRIEARDKDGYEITGVDFTPTEAYDSQSTIETFVLDAGETIYKVAIKMTSKTKNLGMAYCEVFGPSVTYSKYSTSCAVTECELPTFTPAEGTYTSTQSVTINCTTTGAAIHYTTDGTDPTESSPTYSSPISVSSTTTIKAIAVKAGLTNSAIASATYTIVEAEEYELITNLASVDPTDEIVIIADVSGTYYALDNTKNTSSAPTAVSSGFSISGTTLTATATNIQWNIDYDTENNTFVVYSAKDAANWLYCFNNNNGIRVGTGSDKTFKLDDTYEYLYNIGQGRYLGVYNNADWRCYTTMHANIANESFAFYGRSMGTKYTVTTSIPYGHGTATLSNSKIIESTGTITITCVPDAGYTADVVSSTSGTITKKSENVYELTGVTADATVTITFRKLWEISVTTDGHGKAVLSSAYADNNGSVTLTLTPHAGYGDPISVEVTSGTASAGSVTAGSCTVSGIQSDVELTVTFTKLPVYTVHFDAGNGTVGGAAVKDLKETYRGNGVTAPVAIPAASCSGDWEFAYWSTTNQTSETTTAPDGRVDKETKYVPAADNITLYAIYKHTESSGTTTDVEDNFTYSNVGVSGTSYSEWSGLTLSSDAEYAGNTAGGNTAIQMRSSNSNSGIVSTTSGGTLKSISVEWNTNTASGRQISVYGYNTAYTAPSELYAAGTQGSLLGTLTASTTSLDIEAEGDYAYIGIRSKDGALYLDKITITWATASTAEIYYCTSPTCEACTESTHSFASPSVVLTYPHNGTYTNTFTTNNSGTPTYKSSNKSVATVDANTGEVTVVGIGTTTISVHIGKTAGKCAVDDSYEINVKEPTIQVVEVTNNDEIIIEHDFGGNTNALLDQYVTHEEGNVAEEVFFSKYFEASSNVKLLAIYNGTGKAVDPTKLRIRIVSKDGGAVHTVNLADYVGADGMPNGKEIILYSYQTSSNNDNDIMDCVEGKDIDMSDWIKITWSSWTATYPAIIFGGSEAIVLEKTTDGTSWEVMDIIGALSSDGTKADDSNLVKSVGNGTGIPWGDGTSSNPNYGWYCTNGRQIGGDDTDYELATLRCLLIRKFDVLSGKNARNKTTGNWGTGKFNTLCTEWYGQQVSNSSPISSSCNAFAYVGSYNYYNSYQKYEEMNTDAFTATDNGDGTMTIKINPPHSLSEMACNFLKIKVTDATQTNVLSELEYRVPIIVSGDKTTNDAIFTHFGTEDNVCEICDVAILKDATLTPHASGKNILHDVEVYRGAKLTVPNTQTLKINDLILRSTGDEFPQADIQGTLTRSDTKLYFDKRVDENQWYWFALPYDCDIDDVVLRDGTKPTYGIGKDWVLQYYDGVQRANRQAGGCWKVFEETTIKKGVGYILGITPKAGHDYIELRFPMTATKWDYESERATIQVPVTATKSEGITPNHVGWNLVGNPYLTYYKPGNIGQSGASNLIPVGILEKDGAAYKRTNNGVRYVVIPQDGGYSEYKQVAIGDKPLETFMSYFIQIDGNEGTDYAVDFKYAQSRYAASPVRRAPEEYTETEDDHIVWVPITISNVTDEQDETTLLVSNRFTNGYDMMDDLVKWRGDYYKYPQITTKPVLASRNDAGEMAFNALPDSTALQGIPLNYYAANDGMYTIALSDKYGLDEVAEAALFDATTQQWYNLKEDAYTFASKRTDDKSRFTLSLRIERKRIATDIGSPTGNKDELRKVLINGHVYIQRGGKTYDITGKQVLNY
ncbi:MAG: chitobiase/beta-hexosaminidase C-terminal domain-containing protein [Paludibacteraceae bacterium]|nr:chitobiase/beta-hexosaminidase C-terminal domain-containing protein [Paludibacteraceae bacterium]MBQ9295813.1 chitobiase/beta-hexosaminidase C-terminal domain-containing protein [Paludibacteraceae bacterium]